MRSVEPAVHSSENEVSVSSESVVMRYCVTDIG